MDAIDEMAQIDQASRQTIWAILSSYFSNK